MSTRASTAAPSPGRRMLERPPTLDVVGGLERFECLDLPAKLSRSACGQRYSAATKITPGPQGAVQRLAAGPCSECPVGKLHAGEQRRGQLAQLQVVRDGRRSTAPKPAPAHVEAPAAVVPPKRTISRPAAIEPTAQTPDPLHADAQQAVDAGNPVGADDRSGPPESPSPPVAEPPLPPSGEQAAGGRRARTVTCPDCGTVVPRTSNRQKRCGPCGTQRNRAATAARNRTRRGRDPDGARARTRAVAASTGAHGPLPGILITHDGTTDTIEGWATRTGLSSKTIRRRWAKGLRGSDLLGPRRDARADHDRRRAGSAVERSASAKAAERLPTVERPVEASRALEGRPLALAPLSEPERLGGMVHMTPLATLGALAAHMQAWDGSAREARAQVQLAAELLGRLRDRAADAYRREQAARLGLPSSATDDEIAEVLASADLRADLAREGYQLDARPDGHPRVYRPRDVAEGLDGVPRVGSYCVARLVGRERAAEDSTADTLRPPPPGAA